MKITDRINKRYHTRIEFIKDREEGIRESISINMNPNKPENEKIVVYFDGKEDEYVLIENINRLPATIKFDSYDEVAQYLYEFI